MDEQTSSTLIERLDRLERGLWWWKVTGSVAITMLALILLLGATQATVPEEIRAKRFVVVDGNGKTQMILGDSRLDFYWEGQWRGSLEPARWEGEKGELKPGGLLITPRLQVAMFPEMTTRPQVVLDWNRVSVYDSKGDATAELGNGTLELTSEYGRGFVAADRLILESYKQQRRERELLSDRLETLYREKKITEDDLFKQLPQSAASIWLMASRGEPYVKLDENGTSRAVLGRVQLGSSRTEIVEKRPASSLVLYDKDGKVIWKAP